MKKYFFLTRMFFHKLFSFFILVVLLAPLGVFAQVSGPDSSINVNLPNPLGTGTTLAVFLNRILDAVIAIGVPVIIFFVVFSGFLYVTAQGNPEKLRRAHRAILWTLVGAAVLLGAKVISTAIQNTIKAIAS